MATEGRREQGEGGGHASDGRDRDEEDDDEGGGEALPPFEVKKWACQRPTPREHHNSHVTDIFDLLSKLYAVMGDGQRSDSYQRASSVLRSLPRRIQRGSEVAKAYHIGKGMVKDIDQILSTGKLERLEHLRQEPRNVVCIDLCRVHGVGPQTALAWYRSGVRSVEEARRRLVDGDDLPLMKQDTILGLTHFDDLQVAINRDEVSGIAEEVREEAERYGRERDPGGTVLFEVCGGFRRGKETLHDVDMLVSFRKENGDSDHLGFVEGMKKRLVESGKLCATLYQGHMGGFGDKKDESRVSSLEREEVLLGLWQLPGRICRIDIVQVGFAQWPFAVLGWSGTVMFEKDIRRYANDVMGLKLSQKGLSSVASGTPLLDTFRTEEEIFRRLGLEYIPPHLRWA